MLRDFIAVTSHRADSSKIAGTLFFCQVRVCGVLSAARVNATRFLDSVVDRVIKSHYNLDGRNYGNFKIKFYEILIYNLKGVFLYLWIVIFFLCLLLKISKDLLLR